MVCSHTVRHVARHRGARRQPFTAGGRQAKESSSFLKKRTKKLLLVGVSAAVSAPNPKNKSFLFLFFKKEILPCFAIGRVYPRYTRPDAAVSQSGAWATNAASRVLSNP